MMTLRRPQPGFTLVELIVVIVLTGIMAGGMIMFFKPAIQNYLAVSRRASLSNMADNAVRMINSEVRSAVPNSIRLINNRCVELVPTSDGGRFRMAPDTVWDAANSTAPSAPMDLTEPRAVFDVLTPFSATPIPGDRVVIGNQTTTDVYSGASTGVILRVEAPPNAALGRSRITMTQPEQFPLGYEGGSFMISPRIKQAVTYSCSNGVLYRFSAYGFNVLAPTACPTPTTATPILAARVATCNFSFIPNQGATQQSGFLEVQLGLADGDETATINFGVHVDNAP